MITVTFDARALKVAIDGLQGRVANMRPALAAAAQVLREAAMQAFDESRSPDGKAWPSLKPASIVSRARRHSPKGYAKNRARTLARYADAKPLLDTGQLRNSIQVYSVTDTEAVVGTKLPHAAIHQFGGRAGRGRRVSIPARPFLGLSEQAKSEIEDIIRRHVAGGVGGA